MKNLNELFYDVILANELEGDVGAALRFSHAPGDKSGYSFGVCQFDVKNNDTARKCLEEIGFSDEEIQGIVAETVDVKRFNGRLAAGAEVIQKYDEAQLTYCLDKAMNFGGAFGFPVESPSGVLGLADYVNQYGLPGSGSARFYKSLGRPVNALDVLIFKLGSTKYGQEHGQDCRRRYGNIVKVLEAQNA